MNAVHRKNYRFLEGWESWESWEGLKGWGGSNNVNNEKPKRATQI